MSQQEDDSFDELHRAVSSQELIKALTQRSGAAADPPLVTEVAPTNFANDDALPPQVETTPSQNSTGDGSRPTDLESLVIQLRRDLTDLLSRHQDGLDRRVEEWITKCQDSVTKMLSDQKDKLEALIREGNAAALVSPRQRRPPAVVAEETLATRLERVEEALASKDMSHGSSLGSITTKPARPSRVPMIKDVVEVVEDEDSRTAPLGQITTRSARQSRVSVMQDLSTLDLRRVSLAAGSSGLGLDLHGGRGSHFSRISIASPQLQGSQGPSSCGSVALSNRQLSPGTSRPSHASETSALAAMPSRRERLRQIRHQVSTASWGELAGMAREGTGHAKGTLQRFVAGQAFQTFCCFMILINTVIVGVETEYLTAHAEPSDFLSAFQLALNLWYIAELGIRILAEGWQFFVNAEDWRWNLFDIILVLSSLVEILLTALNVGEIGNLNLERIFRILRIVRVTKTVRIVRFLRFVREFRKMIFSLAVSIQTLIWSMVLLFFVLYTFAIWLCQGVSQFLNAPDAGDQSGGTVMFGAGDSEEVPLEEVLLKYYGSLGTTIYSLFLSISTGIGWGELVEPLFQVHGVLVGLFLVFITISILGVTNVITAVFVESAMSSTMHYKELMVQENQRNKETISRHLRSIFGQMDLDGSGCISLEEMAEFIQDEAMALQSYFEALDISFQDTRTLFQLLDLDDSGEVDIDEFCDGCMRLKGEARSFDINCVLYDLRRVMQKLGNFIHTANCEFETLHRSIQDLPDAVLKASRSRICLADADQPEPAKFKPPPPLPAEKPVDKQFSAAGRAPASKVPKIGSPASPRGTSPREGPGTPCGVRSPRGVNQKALAAASAAIQEAPTAAAAAAAAAALLASRPDAPSFWEGSEGAVAHVSSMPSMPPSHGPPRHGRQAVIDMSSHVPGDAPIPPIQCESEEGLEQIHHAAQPRRSNQVILFQTGSQSSA